MIGAEERTGMRNNEDTMQNYQVTPYQGNHEQEISQRTQFLVDSLKDLWNRPHTPSREELKRWIYSLPKVYMRQLAQEHLLANPQMHFTVTVHTMAVAS